ncbi:MAG TPA: cysteine desulfurase family protein [Chlamydiales bacterium]|jgi:cysteine desulfurase|nr:cysteine desulfurase family protein [Chlamydiales bacterium]
MQKIYFDNNSTTSLDPRVLQAMMEDLGGPPANPSSVHFFGVRAKKLLQNARHSIANFFGVLPEEIIFTSGGTESLNLMLRGLPKGHLITTDIEHAAVYKTMQAIETTGTKVTYIKPGLWGAAIPEQIEASIRPETKAIILCAANNETGVKLDIEGAAFVASRHRIPLLLDAVSWIGKESFALPAGVSAIAVSGHKFHAPKGVGILIKKIPFKLTSLATGGNQEYNLRAGTENLAGILGLSEGLKILRERQTPLTEHLMALRAHFECELLRALPDLTINGLGPRIANTVNIAFLGCDGESLLMQLDMVGIALSLGSACSSGALEPSRVLTNMGLDRKTARSSIRFSFGRFNTKEEVNAALEKIVPLVKKMRRII